MTKVFWLAKNEYSFYSGKIFKKIKSASSLQEITPNPLCSIWRTVTNHFKVLTPSGEFSHCPRLSTLWDLKNQWGNFIQNKNVSTLNWERSKWHHSTSTSSIWHQLVQRLRISKNKTTKTRKERGRWLVGGGRVIYRQYIYNSIPAQALNLGAMMVLVRSWKH